MPRQFLEFLGAMQHGSSQMTPYWTLTQTLDNSHNSQDHLEEESKDNVGITVRVIAWLGKHPDER
jgi:hypothetical protein